MSLPLLGSLKTCFIIMLVYLEISINEFYLENVPDTIKFF